MSSVRILKEKGERIHPEGCESCKSHLAAADKYVYRINGSKHAQDGWHVYATRKQAEDMIENLKIVYGEEE